MSKKGRPSKLEKVNLEQIEALAQYGLTKHRWRCAPPLMLNVSPTVELCARHWSEQGAPDRRRSSSSTAGSIP